MNSQRHHKHGITLIEVIIVITIVLILMVLVLPAFANVREAGRLTICSSNQRQIGIDMVDDLNNNDMVFPSLYYVMRHSDPSILVDPSDPNPLTLPADALGTEHDVSMSYAVNPEYYLYGASFDNLSNPSKTIMMYDGFGGGVDGHATDGSGNFQVNGNLIIDGNKATFTHIPPGNPGNANVITTSINALKAHIGHPERAHYDLPGNWIVGEGINAPYGLRGDFVRRHWSAKSHGVVLFADGHVEALTELDDSMFLDADVPLPVGYGEDSGSGNGNGNGKKK